MSLDVLTYDSQLSALSSLVRGSQAPLLHSLHHHNIVIGRGKQVDLVKVNFGGVGEGEKRATRACGKRRIEKRLSS